MTDPRQRLTIVPLDFASACDFVRRHHRHHLPSIGHKFSLGVVDEHGMLRGAATIGRPVSRASDNGWTLEVNRVATDGCPNACSALYSAAWRAAKSLGYRKLITYTLTSESGASLRGAGWTVVGEAVGGKTWNGNPILRPRSSVNLGLKLRWEVSEEAP